MSKLTAIRKQIAALEAEAARIGQVEIKAAIAKVKEIMSEFGLTIEHLSGAISKVGKKAFGKKKAAAKRAGGSVAKYADPNTGKTWSGFGRAPAWIANAKSRDAFLITKSDAAASGAAPAKAPAKKSKAVAAKKASPVKVAKAVKTAKRPAAKAPAAKKPAGEKASTATAKPPVAKKKAKAPAKKAAARKSTTSAAAEPASAASAPTAA
jgi:DNA-binding protein H-NS